jgi:D-alanine-D-alanine ligase
MPKSEAHIEIVRTSIRGLSSMSQVSCDAICSLLAKHFTSVGYKIVNNLPDLESVVDCRPDLIFLGMEFIYDNSAKVWLSDYFDERGIAYTGSNQKALRLQRNKPLAKQRVLNAGLKSSEFIVIRQDQTIKQQEITLNFPLFVKPTNRGGGVGVDRDSVVRNFDQLCSKVKAIGTEFDSDSLIENYLPGREFSVAVLKDEETSGYYVMPIELVAPIDKNGDRLLSENVKTSNKEKVLSVSDVKLKSKVCQLALDVFNALGARDFGRFDIRLDQNGEPNFLEANLIPSLIAGYGSFPKACMLNIGLNYEGMILKIARLGLVRNSSVIEAEAAASLIDIFGFPIGKIAVS